VLESDGDVRPLVDLDWKQTYDGRDQNPFTDAELCTGTSEKITAIGKGVADFHNCRSEFTGLTYFNSEGSDKFRSLYGEIRKEYEDGTRKNLAGVPFRKAYVTHLLQEMIMRGQNLAPVEINGGWIEVDTMMDYNKAVEMFG